MGNNDPELEAFLTGQAAASQADAEAHNAEAESIERVEKLKAHFGVAGPAGEEKEDEFEKATLEQALTEYHTLNEKMRLMEELLGGLRRQILKAVGQGEQAMAGSYAAFVKTRKNTRTDWQRFAIDQFGKDGLKDIIGPYITESESKVLEVKRVGR